MRIWCSGSFSSGLVSIMQCQIPFRVKVKSNILWACLEHYGVLQPVGACFVGDTVTIERWTEDRFNFKISVEKAPGNTEEPTQGTRLRRRCSAKLFVSCHCPPCSRFVPSCPLLSCSILSCHLRLYEAQILSCPGVASSCSILTF